jgi:putative MATE family efflux protein
VSEALPEPAPAPLRGDLTRGPILKTLLLFSIPTLLANLIQTLNGTINSIFVGQLIGEGAVAATANGNMILFVIFSIIFGFGTASSILIGQHFGARELDQARRSFGSGLGFAVVVAVAVAVLGWVTAPAQLRLLSTPEAIHADALAYLRALFVSMPFGAISLFISMALRGAGDARTPLWGSVLVLVLAAAFNPLLILGLGPFPALGIAGSAYGNAIASLIGVAAMIALMYRANSVLCPHRVERDFLVPSRGELRFVLTKGLPMGGQMAIGSFSGVILVGLVNREGMIPAAAYGALLQLWNYVQMPSFAINMAVGAMAAQAIGARAHDRVDRVTTAGVWTNVALTGAITLLFIPLDRPLVALFLDNGSAAAALAEHIQLIATWSYVLAAAAMIYAATMRAYGAVMLPLSAMVIAMYPVRLGFYELAYPAMGAEAIWWSYPVGSATSLLLTWLAFRFGRWRILSAKA